MSELSKLPNIGKMLEKQLNEIEITNEEQLKHIGSKQAWLKIKTNDPSACYNRLCALEGAIQGIRWHYLSDEIKRLLKNFIILISDKIKKHYSFFEYCNVIDRVGF